MFISCGPKTSVFGTPSPLTMRAQAYNKYNPSHRPEKWQLDYDCSVVVLFTYVSIYVYMQ